MGLPAESVTVTVAVAAFAAAVSGVPLMAPVPERMVSPEGSPVALYDAMSASVVVGVTARDGHAHLERRRRGVAHRGRGEVHGRGCASPRLGEVNPLLLALTDTATLVPVM